MSRRAFGIALVAILGLALAQSVVHLELVLGAQRIDTFVDLERSNSLPDIISTIALGAAAAGAFALALRENGVRRVPGVALAVAVGALALADLVHDGAHPYSTTGRAVIGLVLAVGVLLALALPSFTRRSCGVLFVGASLLAASFLVNGLDRYEPWFERKRGDPIAEFQIVAKEGLELIGWSLVALVLWDEALRRRTRHARVTAPASPARARPRRRAA